MKYRKLVISVVVGMFGIAWALLMLGAITLPTAVILIATKLEGLVASVVLVGLAVTMSNGAMTSVRNVDRFTPSRRSMMITAASMTYAGVAPYIIGILVLLMLKFSGKVDEAMWLFWGCSCLLGLGAVLMLLGVSIMSFLHGQNAWEEGNQQGPPASPDQGDGNNETPGALGAGNTPAIRPIEQTGPNPVPKAK